MSGARQDGSICTHLVISGRVQGVWYRGWAVDQATRRGLTGWVRNRGDGTVEAVACGPQAAVDDFVLACEEGPPAARVVEIRRERGADPHLDGFEAWPTV